MNSARKVVDDHLRMQILLKAASENRPGLRHHVPAYAHAIELLTTVLKEIDGLKIGADCERAADG